MRRPEERSAPSCPSCGRAVPTDSEDRPFCSPRCRMVDLGAWLLGHYRIPAASPSGAGPEPASPDDDDPAP